jgi:hypothetical protein
MDALTHPPSDPPTHPPVTYVSPLISKIEKLIIAVGNGGPKVSKKGKK